MTKASEEATCEVCKASPARKEDLLCPDCARAFVLMLELLHNHPELSAEDLRRIKDVFEWRTGKYALTKHEATQAPLSKVGPLISTA